MKKLLIIFLSLLLCNVIHAQKITEQQALEKAKAFMTGKTFSNKERSLRRAIAKDVNDAFYIFNADDNNGFVIVSGDERTEDILGYSEMGNIDLGNMPQNLQLWLEGYRSEIQNLGNKPIQKIRRTAKSAVAPLIQTKWSQGYPYSSLCPVTNGNQCPTGCTATAMAQVMYYYKWPQIETAEIPEYTGGCSKIFCPTLPPTIFDWDKMRLDYNTTNGVPDYSQEEADAVAKLMRYCGQAVHMDYQPGGSGGRVYAPTMVYKFGYGWNARDVNRSGYSTSDWEDMMYKEVSEGRPVLYTGYPHTGHEFICDGYDGNGLYHINWGWAGYCDGYFALSILDINYEGINGGYSSDGFSMSHVAVIGIEPNYNEDFKKLLYFTGYESYRYDGRKSVDNNMGLSIKKLGAKFAYNHNLFNGEYCLAVFQDNQLVEIIPPANGTIFDDEALATCDFSFGANWMDNRSIKLFYRVNNNDEWRDTHTLSYDYKPDDKSPHFSLNSSAFYFWWGVTIGEGKQIETNMTINSITFDNKLIAGVQNFATINVTNTGESYELPMYIDIDGKGVAACSAWLSPQETGEVRISFTPESAGEKTLDIHGTRTFHNNGDDTWEDVTRYYYSEMITIYENIIQGDANGDSEVNVADIVEIVNFILGKPSAKFLETAADLNGDGEVNVSDIVKLVSIIMSANNGSRMRALSLDYTENDLLALAGNNDGSLSLQLKNDGGYVASQFDVRLSDGLSLNNIMLNNGRCNGHLMTYSAIGDNLYRVVIYSPENRSFTGNNGELLKIKTAGTGDVEISNILFITSNQSEKTFSKLHYTATMIQTLETSEPMDVYSLDGRKIRKQAQNTDGLKKGMYIINGQKIIIN